MFVLARDLGYRTVKEMRSEMDFDEYLKWEVLYDLEMREQAGEDTRPKKVVSDPAEIRRFFSQNR